MRNLQDGDLVIDSKCGRLSINNAKNKNAAVALISILTHARLVIPPKCMLSAFKMTLQDIKA
jgi:hypothetical protein